MRVIICSIILICCSLPVCVHARECGRVHACAATLADYPMIEEDSSGWGGSGMVPLYDENVDNLSFDYSQVVVPETFSLCECPNNVTCDSENEANVINLDRAISLTFCGEVKQQLQHECKGPRGLVRVIGRAHSSAEKITSVTDSLAFCHCPRAFQRLRPEFWGGSELSLTYKCV